MSLLVFALNSAVPSHRLRRLPLHRSAYVPYFGRKFRSPVAGRDAGQ
jgi:hypothetical protein